MFLDYLREEGSGNASKASPLLGDIDREFTRIRPELKTLTGKAQTCTAFEVVWPAFLKYRRSISSARQRNSLLPSRPSKTDFHTKVQKSRLLTGLRMARDEFVGTWDDGECQAVDIIRDIFEHLQSSKDETERVKIAIMEGFKGLDEELLRLGNELGFGKWNFAA